MIGAINRIYWKNNYYCIEYTPFPYLHTAAFWFFCCLKQYCRLFSDSLFSKSAIFVFTFFKDRQWVPFIALLIFGITCFQIWWIWWVLQCWNVFIYTHILQFWSTVNWSIILMENPSIILPQIKPLSQKLGQNHNEVLLSDCFIIRNSLKISHHWCQKKPSNSTCSFKLSSVHWSQLTL